ncbi:RnfABCDGE type electron transport complex subunit D [Desulfoluna sp.]|uniref:RnfABCDGE type electron transport complex subunit D n=1 Tax=Desulfoluna sp. TaxID=2045199 RepID=UPI0026211E35|nr:RnfABCDGE type electron transport complex subunit D [Desulfoluna sp.]
MTDSTKLIVSHAPFYRDACTVMKRSYLIMAAALVALIPGWFLFGAPAVGVSALAVASSIFWELTANTLMKQQPTIGDGNAAMIGLILSMLLPATAPWWMVITGTFVAIIMSKIAFGGIGGNPFCPPALSAAVLTVSWPHLMNFNGMLVNYDMAWSMVDPLINVKFFGAETASLYPPLELLFGHQAGGIGAVCGAGLILGGIFLMIRGISSWEICLSFLGGVFVAAFLFNMSNPDLYAGPVFHLLTGYTLVGAFFLATEDSSSPVNLIPMLIYGFGGGMLTVLIRNKGVWVDGVLFAVLLMNLANPILDMIRPKALGKV